MKLLYGYLVCAFFCVNVYAEWNYPPKTIVEVEYEQATNPQLAIDKNGTAIAVWQTKNNTGNTFIFGSFLPQSSDKWSTPVQLSKNPLHFDAIDPKIGVDDKGNVFVVWYEQNLSSLHGPGNDIFVTIFSNELNSWQAPINLSKIEDSNVAAVTPKIAVSANGEAKVIWCLFEEEQSVIQVCSFDHVNGWSPITTIAKYSNPHSLMSKDIGDNAVVWVADSDGYGSGTESVFAKMFDSCSKTWSEKEYQLSEGFGCGAGHVSIKGRMAIWETYSDPYPTSIIQATNFIHR